MESTKEVLVVKSDNLLNENAKIIGGFRGGIVYGSPLFPLPKLTQNFGRTIKFSIKSGTYSLRTFVGDGTVTKDNCLGIYLQDNSGNELQSINSPAHNGINKVSTFTVSADVASKTTQLYIFFNHDVAGRTYEEDTFNGIMINSGDTGKDYEPYYREYESTKEVLVRRSNNLFLPFSSIHDFAIGYDHKFEYDPTLFYTIEENGNIHIHGTKSVLNSGYIVCDNFTAPLTLKAGETYSYKYNNAYGNCSLQSNVSGKRVGVLGNGTRKVTPSIDTPITHIYVDTFAINKEENIGKEYDFYLSPMVVEGDTAQDYEPYYYEAEASKTGIIPDDGSLTSVVDFSTAIKGKRISITSTTSPEGSDGVTINNNDAFAYVPEYYPCQAGDIYKIEYVGQENLPKQTYRQYFIFWYDENKNYLGFYIKYTYGAYTFDPAPTNAKFFRLTYSGLLNGAVTPKEWMLPSNPKLTKVTS